MLSITRFGGMDSLEISARRCGIQYLSSHLAVGIDDENGSTRQYDSLRINFVSIEHIELHRQRAICIIDDRIREC